MSINRLPKGARPPTNRPDMNRIFIGFIKDNADDQNMGRVAVWIPELGGAADDEASWIVMSYAPPFAGSTPVSALKKNATTMDGTQQSYGFVMVPPDLDNQVLCCFVNGDVSQGYWFACIYQQNMNHMVPGIAIDTTTDPNNALAPTVEYNKWSGVNPDNPPRPIFTPLFDGLTKQGLMTDYERGPSSTSMRRESPPLVYGFLTPQGNTIHVDDNDTNQFIRLRTQSGAQIMVSETTGFVYINSKDGNSWIEVSDSGIDVYTNKSISMRAEENFNVHADKNIVMYAGQNISFMAAGGDITSTASGNIFSQAGSAIQAQAGTNFTINAGSDVLSVAGGAMRQQSGGDHSTLAGGNLLRTGSKISDNGPAAPAPNPAAFTPTPAHSTVDIQNGGRVQTQTLVPIFPTHEPWYGHPNSNVPTTWGGPDITSDDLDRIGQEGGQGVPGAPTTTQPAQTSVKTGSGTTKIVDKAYADNSPKVTIGQFHPSEAVVAAIMEGAQISGIDIGYMMAMAAAESGFNPDAKASSSSATGLYQFLDGTWAGMVKRYGAQYNIGLNDRNDPRANAIMGGIYAKENKTYLLANGISPVGDTELYTAHFMGGGGAKKFLAAYQANPNEPVSPPAVTPGSISANPSIFGAGPLKTYAQVYQILSNKIVPNATAFAAAANQPKTTTT